LAIPGGTAVQANPDPWIGTWTLDLAKSRYDPGPAPWASLRTTVEPWGRDGISVTTRGLPAAARLEQIPAPRSTTSMGPSASQPIVRRYKGQFDGTEYRCVEESACDTFTLHRLSDHSFQRVVKSAGVVTVTIVWEVSQDGKTVTVTNTGHTIDGIPVNNITVHHRR
jgi:hypothetical protein